MLDAYEPDGRIVVLAAATGSIEVMREVIAAYPANCPATVILLDAEPALAERAIDRLLPAVACKIETAKNDTMLMPGTVYLAYEKDRHLVVENDYAPILKLVERDPIAGYRPSADMLLASVARAGLPTMAGLLAADHADGARGLDALAKAGALTFLQDRDEIGPIERFAAACQLVPGAAKVPAKSMGEWIIQATNKQKLAA